MGCWNATCQLSQLPIHSGDPVRFLLLTKNPYAMDTFKSSAYSYMREGQKAEDFGYQPNAKAGREGCYSGNFWYPEFVPIRAEYNDYGSVEQLDEACLNWKFWQTTISKRVVELKQGSNQFHDPESKKDMSLDQLLDVLQEGRLIFHEKYHNMNIPVSQTMIREDVYQAMLSIPVEDDWWVKGEEKYCPESIYNHGMKLFQSVPKEEEITRTSFDGGWLIPESENFEARICFHNEHDIDNWFIEGIRSSEDEKGLQRYREWIVGDLLKDKSTAQSIVDSDEFKSLVKDISDFIYVKHIVCNLRKTWHPGTGCGSQSSNTKMTKQYNQSLVKISTAINKEKRSNR